VAKIKQLVHIQLLTKLYEAVVVYQEEKQGNNDGIVRAGALAIIITILQVLCSSEFPPEAIKTIKKSLCGIIALYCKADADLARYVNSALSNLE